MHKVLLLVGMLGMGGLEILSQTKSHFTAREDSTCEKIHFYLKASSGTCEIRTRNGESPINILGRSDEKYIQAEFGQNHEDKVLSAWLNLKDNGKEKFGSKLSKIFGKKVTDTENYWNIYFTDYKPYRLDLVYGLGKAYIDLSGIAVEYLKITSGNAHVNVGYHSRVKNKAIMDTFMVTVDLGDIEIDRLDLARANNILAEVGFGSLVMDFEERPENSSTIWARVGAGTLQVRLPSDPIPMIIKIKNTSYRKLKMPEHFEKIRENVFVSAAYDPAAENLLTFNIDLSMGSVIFTED